MATSPRPPFLPLTLAPDGVTLRIERWHNGARVVEDLPQGQSHWSMMRLTELLQAQLAAEKARVAAEREAERSRARALHRAVWAATARRHGSYFADKTIGQDGRARSAGTGKRKPSSGSAGPAAPTPVDPDILSAL